jgi:D-cysteine desulfhydrase
MERFFFPLFDRFPALAGLPRVELCSLPSPVQSLDHILPDLWIKRDDLNAPICGGNKVRALEFLLGGLHAGDSVVTVGGTGSTHILSTALHAARIGVKTYALRWRHEMNPVASEVSSRIESLIPRPSVHVTPVLPIARARFRAMRQKSRYIPVGGSVPLGVLGHVNGALELAAQIDNGEMPQPSSVIVPMGTGGTAAGLVLGFEAAGLDIEVVGVRTGPRMFSNRRSVLSLANRTARFIGTICGGRMSPIDPNRLRVIHTSYGGAYGRPVEGAARAAADLHEALGIRLDDTYTAKAWMGTVNERRVSRGTILYWFTFDASCLTS